MAVPNEFGVETNFQKITPMTKPDSRAENIKSVIDTTTAIGKAEASKQGREDARYDTEVQPLREANKDLDLFNEKFAQNLASAEVGPSGQLTQRQVDEIKDDTLRKASFRARGLQAGIDSGQLTHMEASARATLDVQRQSNSLVGSLFQDQYRNAYGKITGNPAGSPANTLNKSPKEIQAEANRKAQVAAHAAREGLISSQMAKTGSDRDTAVLQIVAMEKLAQDKAKNEALDAQKLRSDEEKLSTSGTSFVVATSSLMSNVTAAQVSGKGIDPNEVASLTFQIKASTDEIVAGYTASGMGSKAQKAIREAADAWSKKQIDYIQAVSSGTITKEQHELITIGSKNILAAEMPLVYALSATGNNDLAQTMARMTKEQRTEFAHRLSLPIDKLLDLTKEFLTIERVFDPNAVTTPEDRASGVVPAVLAGKNVPPVVAVDVVKKGVEQGVPLGDMFNSKPNLSLMVLASKLAPAIESGDEEVIGYGLHILNNAPKKFKSLLSDREDVLPKGFEYTVDKNPGHANPTITVPTDVNGNILISEDEQELLRQYYKALKATPALWRNEFGSPQEAFEAGMKGHQFTAPEEQIGPSDTIGEFMTNVGNAIGDFADTEGSRVRKSEGIVPTADRDGMPVDIEEVRAQLDARKKAVRPEDVANMIADMDDETFSEFEKFTNIKGGKVEGAGTSAVEGKFRDKGFKISEAQNTAENFNAEVTKYGRLVGAPEPTEGRTFNQQYHQDTIDAGLERKNEDGSTTTAMVIGVEYNGKEYNLPAYDRETKKDLSPEEALAKWKPLIDGGRIQGYDTPQEASKAAREEHKMMEGPSAISQLPEAGDGTLIGNTNKGPASGVTSEVTVSQNIQGDRQVATTAVNGKQLTDTTKKEEVDKLPDRLKTIPLAEGEYDHVLFNAWSTAYNVENKDKKENEKDAKRTMKNLNNPSRSQTRNIAALDNVIDNIAPKVFDNETLIYGFSPEDIRPLLHHTYSAETNLGTGGKRSPTGAAGEMQILTSTALSLMGRGPKAGSQIFGPKAAKASGFDIDAFEAADREGRIDMLINNPTANYLLAIAKYYEQNVRVKKITGIHEQMGNAKAMFPSFDPATGTIR